MVRISGRPVDPATAIPVAVRSRATGWRDPRLWIGVAIVTGSVVAGSRILATADDTVAVWAVTTDMGPGDRVGSADLVAERVRFADGDDLARYVVVTETIGDDVAVSRALGAGELLPRAALESAADQGFLEVPLAVPPEQVPSSVDRGAVVDVHLVSARHGRQPSTTRPGAPVLAEVTVLDAPDRGGAFGSGGPQQLTLAVPESDARHFFEVLGEYDSPTITVVRRG